MTGYDQTISRATAAEAAAASRWWLVVPAAVSGALIALWVAVGDRYSLWLDEAFSVNLARMRLPTLARYLFSEEANMGPYYYLLSLWTRIDGSAHWARGLSALGTILAVWAIWTLLHRWSGPRVAAAGIVVFAANPFVLSWTIQAQGFTLVMAATAWSLVALDRIGPSRSPSDSYDRFDGYDDVDRRTRAAAGSPATEARAAVAYGLLAGVSSALLLSAAFAHAGLMLATLIARPASWRRLTLSVLAAAAAFAPFGWSYVVNRGQISWIPPLTAEQFTTRSLNVLGGPAAALLAAAAVAMLLLLGAWHPVTRRYLVPVAGTATGFGGVVAVSLTVQPMFIERYLSACVPLLAVAVAGGIAATAATLRGRGTGVLAVIVAAAAVAVVAFDPAQAAPSRIEDYRHADAVIADGYRGGDAVAAFPGFSHIAIERNWPAGTLRPAYVRVGETGLETLDGTAADPERIWLVLRGPVDEMPEADQNAFTQVRSRYPVTVSETRDGVLTVILLSRAAD